MIVIDGKEANSLWGKGNTQLVYYLYQLGIDNKSLWTSKTKAKFIRCVKK